MRDGDSVPDAPPSDARTGGFGPPLLLALIIVVTSPVMSRIRNFLFDSLGTRFALVLAVGLGVAIAASVVAAALRIREPRPATRWLRFGGLALALVLLGIQVLGFGTGNPLIDAVERFHLIEYGLLGALFYRAFRRYGDASVLPLTMLAVTLVGTVDEFVQWWTPLRVGDARDVLLNAYAGLCGMLFGLALAPPSGWVVHGGRAAGRRVGRAAALTWLAFAYFYDRAYLGYEITDPEAGAFRDWHPREELLQLKAQRAAEWAAKAPAALSAMGPEDFYLTAAMRHVEFRDDSLRSGDWSHAWKENRILETYYTPYLELTSFGGASVRYRLTPEELQALETNRPQPDQVPYDSAPLQIAVVSRPAFWAGAIAAALVLAGLPELIRRRKPSRFHR